MLIRFALRLSLIAVLACSAPFTASALENISLQLKWKHAFQFAGYYMALEKGYYNEAGLNVNIIEGGPDRSPIKHVAIREGHYAVSDSGILLAYAKGHPVKVLSAIFQHSPLALAVRKNSGIKAFKELRGKRIMMQRDEMDASIVAAIHKAGLSDSDFIRLDTSFNLDDLILGNTDAFSVYTTDQPHQLKERGIAYRTLHPIEYDIDFYGDLLFTSNHEIDRHPERVKAFIKSSLRGWHYALEHIDEAIHVIRNRYNTQNLSLEQLHFEARKTRDMILKDEIELGYINKHRWSQISKTYIDLGLIPETLSLNNFLYKSEPDFMEIIRHYRWQTVILILLFLLTILAIQTVVLRRMVRSRTQKLKRSEKTYHGIFNSLKEGVYIQDREGHFLDVNEGAVRMYGYPREVFIGQSPEFLSAPGRNDMEMVGRCVQKAFAGESQQLEYWGLDADGREFPKDLRLYPGEYFGQKAVIAIAQDISEKIHLESQLLQSQKMEAIGTLVGGIAHDFNNMLAGITGNLYLAQVEAHENPGMLEKLNKAEKLSFRAANMIEQLLTFARKDRVSMERISLAPFINETFDFLRSSVPENIDMHLDICCDSISIIGDPTQLHQVVMNLVNNAHDAVKEAEDPIITIRLNTFLTDDAFIESHAYFKAGAYAHLMVEDNGYGISNDLFNHLYEPFFTTKEIGEGTGLGLSMVFGSIKTHQGFVEVESIKGKGSIFHVYIPLLEDAEPLSTPLQKEVVTTTGRGETILLVDDETFILEMGREVLKSLGYRVLTATNGLEAIDIFTANENEISLVILDVVMPKLGGLKASERIRKIRPDVKIIFCTGYDMEETWPDKLSLGKEVILSKPCNIEEMRKTIRDHLDS